LTATLAALALKLWSFAEVRLAAAEELPEALAAIEESVALYAALADESNARAASAMRADVLAALAQADRPPTGRVRTSRARCRPW
jgi:DNA-binding GntR family transcriptional regulator